MERFENPGWSLTEDERAPGADEIQVTIPVDIPNPRAVTTRDKGRRPTDRAVGTNRAVDATRNQALRGLEKFRRPIGAYGRS
jgi:hypothetical protein